MQATQSNLRHQFWHDMLSTRAYNCIARTYSRYTDNGFRIMPTVTEIKAVPNSELLQLKNFGKKSLEELHNAIATYEHINEVNDANNRT